jgi:ribosomal protein S18 acetylase RimI-like enzyme
MLVETAIEQGWVWLAPGAVATSVWIPPGGRELTEAQEETVEPVFTELLGSGVGRLLATLDVFDASHPHDEPHYYLSLLGTDPLRRGNRHGLSLLSDNLATLDELGASAYLEASNPGNVALYERYGFEVFGGFDLPEGGPRVITMWRQGQPAS